jgi:hypothetical protein
MRSIRLSLMAYFLFGQAIDLALIHGMVREANLLTQLDARR